MDHEQWIREQRRLRAALHDSVIEPRGRLNARSGRDVPPASVIVVCRDAAAVITRCLQQLLDQDYPDYEIVVVDDGSEDETRELARRMSSAGRIIVVGTAVSHGVSHARNLGLRHAQGEILAFMDADGFADCSWLRHLVATFESDRSLGAVASTVFRAWNPLVINGAGGIVNRQGWAADLSINESYEWVEIAGEALYPMGCGMALRRDCAERIGPFDERILNYYDDVDIGIRVWRAGYRVAVAPDAWVDHGVPETDRDPARLQLLCERHRMRVVLKHAPVRTLSRWWGSELRAATKAQASRRRIKLKAMAWNAKHVGSVVASRGRLRGSPSAPAQLIDPSWGDAFPAGVPPLARPIPEAAMSHLDMADPASGDQLVYGWFPREQVNGRCYRWAATHAAALVRLEQPATRLRLRFAHVPVDNGGIDVRVRRLGSDDPLNVVWSTRIPWQYMARCVENHPLSLEPGDYEASFNAVRGWSDPPSETRSLGLALESMCLEESFEIPSGGLDMASPGVEEQLVSGWFEAEHGEGRAYRWTAAHASAVVRLEKAAKRARLAYRMAPGDVGEITVSMRRLGERDRTWAASIPVRGGWRVAQLPGSLPAADYVLSFECASTWSNPGQRQADLPPENRSIGIALSSVSFI